MYRFSAFNLLYYNNFSLYKRKKSYLSSILFCLTSVIIFYILTDLIITIEFQVNYPDFTKLHIFLICLGAANILVHIVYNNNKLSYYTNIKKNIEIYWPYVKQKPLFCICIFIGALCVFLVVVNFYTGLMGITVSTKTHFEYYIYILTKVILIKNTISLFLLPFTKNREKWYNIVGMSIWLPLALIPSSLFYIFYLLPVVIRFRGGLMDILHIGLTKFENNLYEFKLAIIYVVDDINIVLSNLKEWWFSLKPLFFFYKKLRWTIN